MSKLYVNIANTPETLAKGLMFVKDMPPDEGMLFSFSRVQPLRFWGENTFLPLDIAFVDGDGVIREISKISPFSRKTVESSIPCKYAIEANDGFFKEHRIEIGDKIIINKDDDRCFLTFASKRRNTDPSASNARVRELLAQIMGPDVAYDLDPQSGQSTSQPDAASIDDPNLPTIRGDDIGQYLEDDLEEQPEGIEVAPPEEELPQQPQEPQPVPETEGEYPEFTGPSSVMEAITWAKENNEVMRISYTTKKGTPIERDVEPHGTFHSESTGKEILVTFDETIGNIRAFIIINIRTFAFTGKTFEKKFRLA